jgi:hypothetical protein
MGIRAFEAQSAAMAPIRETVIANAERLGQWQAAAISGYDWARPTGSRANSSIRERRPPPKGNDLVAALLYPASISNLSSVDEAEAMTEKQLKTADELKRIIMQEIRKNPNCSSVQAVEIMPASEQSGPHPNWRVSIWTLEGEPSAPPCADDIERDIQSKFALA